MKRSRHCLLFAPLAVALAFAVAAPAAAAADREVVRRDPPFAERQQQRETALGYAQPAPATRRWHLCAVFPHVKDAYWLGVDYGMMDEARRLGVELSLLEAGGYPNLEIQREQVRDCASRTPVDALIVGTVSFDALRDVIAEVAKRMPVLATVNDIAPDGIAAKVGVSWYDMGWQTGRYLVQRHPGTAQSGPPVPVAWFPGPRDAGWVPFVEHGFRDAIAGSRIVVRHTAWGDTAKAVQRNLVQATLDDDGDVRYLVGNALMAEAAISVLRERGRQDAIGIVSTYFTPAVYRGIMRGRIVAAPSDSPVLQGRLSIDQAVGLLEGRPGVARQIGPRVRMIDRASLPALHLADSLAPSDFVLQFRYVPPTRK